MGQTSFILASASPRRRELLERMGLRFFVEPVEVDERPRAGEDPDIYVARVAWEKAAQGASRRPGSLVLAADTTVVLEGAILGKPEDPEHARTMLRALSGKTHEVLTAVSLAGALPGARPAAGRPTPPFHRLVRTRVTFCALTAAEIDWYVRSGEPLDKAGAYAIQGIGGMWVRAIQGSHSNVIGLPLVETVELLRDAGLVFPWSEP